MRMLCCILDNNDCFRTGQYIKPKGIMIHSTGANNPTLRRYVQPSPGCADYTELMEVLGDNRNNNHWNRSGLSVCVHGFIGSLADGSVAVVQTLPWDMRGWHAGKGKNGSANDTHIAFEICEDTLEGGAYFGAVYHAAVELTAMLCQRFGLNPLADGVIICHSEGNARGIASNHADVTHWFPKHGKTMEDFRADVAAKMGRDAEEERFAALMAQYRARLQDNDAADYSESARRWAVDHGLIRGSDGKAFNGMWEDFLTREQAVVLLFRFWDKLIRCENECFLTE